MKNEEISTNGKMNEILFYADIFSARKCMKMNKEVPIRPLLEKYKGRPGHYSVLN